MNLLKKYTKKRILLVIIPSIFLFLNIALDMFNPYILKIITDDVVVKKSISMLNKLVLMLVLIGIFRAIFGYLKEYLFDLYAAEFAKDLQKDLFDHIQNLSFSYFDNMNTGEIMSRIGEDVENVWMSLGFGVRLFIENILYFILGFILIFRINSTLALASFVSVLPIIFLAIISEKKVGKVYGKLSDQATVLNTTAQENISGVRLVKAFSREKHEILKFLGHNKENFKLQMELASEIGTFLPRIDFLTAFANLIVILLGGYFIIKGKMSIGDLVASTAYINMLIWAFRIIGFVTNNLAQSKASLSRLNAIFEVKPHIQENPNGVILNDIKGHIEFKNISFKYNEESVLKDINIEIKPKQTLAIMGTTGAGKTSLINLIGRYYDVSEGEVKVDDVNVKDVKLRPLREQMSVISQDTFLFSDSVKNNISMSKPEATMDEIREAAKDACALEFIKDLTDGFETIVGERGIGLSGGQKQRLSIARALLRNSKILILDDATSALDMDTEYELLKNLNNRKSPQTTIIIAHRISAVKNANEIIFMDKGEIIERGTHEELLNKKGRYFEVYLEQFKDFDTLNKEVV